MEIVMILVILVAEEQDRVDVVTAKQERFISRDGRRNPAQFRVRNQNNRKPKWPVEINLGVPTRPRRMNTAGRFDKCQVDFILAPRRQGIVN